MSKDEFFMRRCLELAAKGSGNVAPNPMVGCVIVVDGKIIAEGYHEKFGGPHAEVNAINTVPENLQSQLPQATLYVNLEPCSHFGKTPPCADLIIRHKIPRVVIGTVDPNPLVGGKGIDKLKEAGIEVISGVLAQECEFLNRRFITYWKQQRPYIILKWAQSSDGFIALAEPRQFWLTGKESRKLVHHWRGEEQAVLVGKTTVRIDNPQLTVRFAEGKNPVRITIDKYLHLSQGDYSFFEPNAPLLIFNALKNEGPFVKIDFDKEGLLQIMRQLFDREIQSLIVEGGPFTLQQFIEAGLWDEARIFTSAHILKTGLPSPIFNAPLSREEKVGADILRIYYRQISSRL